jgi:hypothetical protein
VITKLVLLLYNESDVYTIRPAFEKTLKKFINSNMIIQLPIEAADLGKGLAIN